VLVNYCGFGEAFAIPSSGVAEPLWLSAKAMQRVTVMTLGPRPEVVELVPMDGSTERRIIRSCFLTHRERKPSRNTSPYAAVDAII
jgi:hypothetical protein